MNYECQKLIESATTSEGIHQKFLLLIDWHWFPDFSFHLLISSFQFEGQETKLDPKVGIFITMNPGYAGRTELPESIKALFRPVTCIMPDLELICMISLFSDGFLTAKVLAKKMTVLYKLAREQLSKQFHYDWGLRSLNSVLRWFWDLYSVFINLKRL